MKNTLVRLALAATLAFSGCSKEVKSWTDSEIKNSHNHIAFPLPMEVNGQATAFAYECVDLNGDGKVDVIVQNNSSVAAMVAPELRNSPLLKSRYIVTKETTDFTPEVRDTASRVYQANLDFKRTLLESQGRYSTNSN